MVILAVLSIVVSGASDAPVTVGSLQSLRPEAVGRQVLQGHDHGTIVAVLSEPRGAMDMPEWRRLSLFEAPIRIAAGCSRKKWSAYFQAEPGSPASTGTLSGSYPATEVALPEGGSCRNADFVHVNQGLSTERALEALQHLQEIRSGTRKVRFTCSDKTGSDLCQSPEAILEELTKLRVWGMNPGTELWLGERGQSTTKVFLSPINLDEVEVRREVPAPF